MSESKELRKDLPSSATNIYVYTFYIYILQVVCCVSPCVSPRGEVRNVATVFNILAFKMFNTTFNTITVSTEIVQSQCPIGAPAPAPCGASWSLLKLAGVDAVNFMISYLS